MTRWLFMMLGAALAVMPSRGSPQWKGTVVKEGEVTVVRNPKEPMFKGQVLSFAEELSIPTTGAQEQYLISEIRQIVVDDQGNIYILDRKASDIKVFDGSGKFVRTIGRKGQGPGELSSPTSISINRKKNELCVIQVTRRISFFSLDGTFLRNLSTATTWALLGGVDSAGNIVITEGIVTPPNPAYAVKKFDGDMKLLAELARTPANTPRTFDAFFPALRWTLDDEDDVIYGYPKTYELQIFNAQNKLVRKIEKDYDPVKVTEAEVAEGMKEVVEGITANFSKVHPAFRNIMADDEGRIYVQTWQKDAGGQCVHYDLFDEDGRFLAVLTLKERAVIRKGKMYTVEEDEDGFQTIKRYAVAWNLK